MHFKRWMMILAAALMVPAMGHAQDGIDTPIGEQVAVEDPLMDDGGDAQLPAFEYTPADPQVGQPTGGMGLQGQVTEIGREAAAFHNGLLLWMICVGISLFVLALLLYTMIRYRRSANPTPSRTTHNTAIEIAWTVVPVIILIIIAIPSIKLIDKQYSPPPADVTVKVIGNQWYWTYEYPDHGGFEIISNMLPEQEDAEPGSRFRTDADGPARLAVDERIVIPVGKTVKFLLTSNDVLHSFAVPAFWTKMDTVPGRINETWVNVDKEGVYFGQCSELCGARHAYMPIAVEVVSEERFAEWVAFKGGSMPGTQLASELVEEDEQSAADALEVGDDAAAEEALAAARANS